MLIVQSSRCAGAVQSTNKLYERKFVLRGGRVEGLLRFEKAKEQINNNIVKNLRFKMLSLIFCKH